MKNILVSFLLIIYLTVNAQVEKKDSIINGDQLSEKEIYNTKRDGWAILKYNSQDFLINFSNNDYLLWLKVNCKNNLIKPSFLIEFTNNYRDGGRGGIDFTSSKDDRFKKIVFL